MCGKATAPHADVVSEWSWRGGKTSQHRSTRLYLASPIVRIRKIFLFRSHWLSWELTLILDSDSGLKWNSIAKFTSCFDFALVSGRTAWQLLQIFQPWLLHGLPLLVTTFHLTFTYPPITSPVAPAWILTLPDFPPNKHPLLICPTVLHFKDIQTLIRAIKEEYT